MLKALFITNLWINILQLSVNLTTFEHRSNKKINLIIEIFTSHASNEETYL